MIIHATSAGAEYAFGELNKPFAVLRNYEETTANSQLGFETIEFKQEFDAASKTLTVSGIGKFTNRESYADLIFYDNKFSPRKAAITIRLRDSKPEAYFKMGPKGAEIAGKIFNFIDICGYADADYTLWSGPGAVMTVDKTDTTIDSGESVASKGMGHMIVPSALQIKTSNGLCQNFNPQELQAKLQAWLEINPYGLKPGDAAAQLKKQNIQFYPGDHSFSGIDSYISAGTSMSFEIKWNENKGQYEVLPAFRIMARNAGKVAWQRAAGLKVFNFGFGGLLGSPALTDTSTDNSLQRPAAGAGRVIESLKGLQVTIVGIGDLKKKIEIRNGLAGRGTENDDMKWENRELGLVQINIEDTQSVLGSGLNRRQRQDVDHYIIYARGALLPYQDKSNLLCRTVRTSSGHSCIIRLPTNGRKDNQANAYYRFYANRAIQTTTQYPVMAVEQTPFSELVYKGFIPVDGTTPITIRGNNVPLQNVYMENDIPVDISEKGKIGIFSYPDIAQAYHPSSKPIREPQYDPFLR